MFSNYIPKNTFNFSNTLTTISKTLNIANQAIPIYREIKPMVSNAKNILNTLKELKIPNIKSNNTESKEIKKEEVITSSNLTFFQ